MNKLFETEKYFMTKNLKDKYEVLSKDIPPLLQGTYQFYGEAMCMTLYLTTYGTTEGMRAN